MDEDLIPYYYCIVCKGNICKDCVGKKLKGRDVICIDCYKEEHTNGSSN